MLLHPPAQICHQELHPLPLQLFEPMVGGIDFGYRLMGKPKSRTNQWSNQLWVYGETVHGVRSTDVDCSKNATFLTCQTALAIPNRPADQILYTFRNATSLEGFAGF